PYLGRRAAGRGHPWLLSSGPGRENGGCATLSLRPACLGLERWVPVCSPPGPEPSIAAAPESRRKGYRLPTEAHQSRRRTVMEFEKEFVIDEIKKQGESPRVQAALDELPARIDHEKDAALLQKYGV